MEPARQSRCNNARPDSLEGPPLEATQEEESLIVEQAQRGDPAAFGLLVQRYQEAAFHLAYVIVGEASDAEDVAQDAFLKAYVALPRFQVNAPFRPWLLQIVANEARNWRRSSGRRAHLTMRAAADERISLSGLAPSPEAIALADEQRRALLSEVDALRDEDRLAIAGRYFMDLSEAEVATLLGCARGTVKSRVSRGLARLRQRMRAREAVAALVALLSLALGLLAWPEAREAIAERLGVRGVRITYIEAVPTAIPTPAVTAVPTAGSLPGANLGLGAPLTLADARQRFGVPILVPAELGTPDAIYMTSGQVWLVYASRPSLPRVSEAGGLGLVLTEFRAALDPSLTLGKGVPPGARVEEVRVSGNRALWVDGAPHVFFRDTNGNVRDAPPRLANNTLLWEQGGLTLRIESGLGREAAIAIAETVRGTD